MSAGHAFIVRLLVGRFGRRGSQNYGETVPEHEKGTEENHSIYQLGHFP
jgi:hypothetical protein